MDRESQKPAAGDGASAPPDFETALARMEAIVFELEEGRIGLAEALARYEEGVGLLRQCFALLETAERRIELLTGVDAAGNPVAEPYDATASAERAEQGAPRSRQRSTGGAKSNKAARTTASPPADASPSPAKQSASSAQPPKTACDPDAPPGTSNVDDRGRLF